MTLCESCILLEFGECVRSVYGRTVFCDEYEFGGGEDGVRGQEDDIALDVLLDTLASGIDSGDSEDEGRGMPDVRGSRAGVLHGRIVA